MKPLAAVALIAAVAALAAASAGVRAQAVASNSSTTTYRFVTVDGLKIFYREAGPRDAPTILMLHSYPSSSRMFATLIPLLADRYHLVAPDYPGFGESDAPPASEFAYTFDHLARVVADFTQVVGLRDYVLLQQDYGGPIGMRLAVAHPERVRAIIVQNAVAHEDRSRPGLGHSPRLLEGPRGLRGQGDPSDSRRSKAPGRGISARLRIPSATTRRLGSGRALICRGRASVRSSPISSSTTRPMSPPTRHGRPG